MRLRSTMRLVALAAAIAIVGVFAAVAAGVESPPPPPNPDNPYEDDPVVRREIKRQLKERDAREDKRKTDEAKADRKASRTRFKDKSDKDALAIARAKFERFLDAPTFSGLSLRPGEKVKQYVDDFQALLQNDEGDVSLVESELPLRNEDDQPTDLGLEARGDGFAPVAAPVDLDLPGDLSDGIAMADGQLRIKPVTDAATDATQTGEKVFYGNALTDTDVLVKPTAQGFETFTQLRSAESPEQVSFDVEVPGGATLREADRRGLDDDRGAAPIEVVSPGGKRIATISPPRAVAADGEPVDSTYSIDGMRVTMNVAHRDRDVAYPILVDPDYIYEEWLHWATGNRDQYGWQAGSWGHPWCGWGAYFGAGQWTYGRVVLHPDGYYCEVDNWAEWKFQAPRMSYIYRAEYHYMNHQNRFTCAVNGLWAPWAGNWDGGWAWVYCGDLWNHARGHCPISNDCNWDYGAPSNVAVFKVQIAYGNGNRNPGARAELGGSLIYMRDRENPVVDATGQQTDGRWYTAGSGNTSVYPRAHDDGLGMNKFQLIVPGRADEYRYHPCIRSRCPGSWSLPNDGQSQFTYNIDALPEGVNTIRVNARDVLDKITGATYTVNVDRGIPNLNVYGPLRDAVYAGRWWGTKTLSIQSSDGVNDGNPANQRSGVTAVDIYVDGVRKHQQTQFCFASCALNFDWTFNASQYTPGDHSIRVVARDGAGNERSSSTWTVTTTQTDPSASKDVMETVDNGATPETATPMDPNACQDPAMYCGQNDATNQAEIDANNEPPLAGPTFEGPGLPKINPGSKGWGWAEGDYLNFDLRLTKKLFENKPVKYARVIIPWDILLLRDGVPNTVPGYSADNRMNYFWWERDTARGDGYAVGKTYRAPITDEFYKKYDRWMARAAANGWKVMISFGATEVNVPNFEGKPDYKLGSRTLPAPYYNNDPQTGAPSPFAPVSYIENVKKILAEFRGKYPSLDIRYLSAWNEPNHPAYGPSGRLSYPHLRTLQEEKDDITSFSQMVQGASFAGAYYNVLRKFCGDPANNCNVLAGEMVDRGDMARYFNIYKGVINKKPVAWAFHPYISGALGAKSSGLADDDGDSIPNWKERFAFYMKATGEGDGTTGPEVWFTEVGPLYAGKNGNPDWDTGVTQLNRQMDLARHPRVKRFYYYSTRGDRTAHDSGFIDPQKEALGPSVVPNRAEQIRPAYCRYGQMTQGTFSFGRIQGDPPDKPTPRIYADDEASWKKDVFIDGVRGC